jgi:hypothetical protein
MPVQAATFFSFMAVDFFFTVFLNTGHSTESFGEVDQLFTYLKMFFAEDRVKIGPTAVFESPHAEVVYYR